MVEQPQRFGFARQPQQIQETTPQRDYSSEFAKAQTSEEKIRINIEKEYNDAFVKVFR